MLSNSARRWKQAQSRPFLQGTISWTALGKIRVVKRSILFCFLLVVLESVEVFYDFGKFVEGCTRVLRVALHDRKLLGESKKK